jgi:formate hydrogenlyase subunit 4
MAFAIGAGILNLFIALGLSPLYEGIARKMVRARVHSRQGPPIRQPYFDLLKLLGKEDMQVSAGRTVGLAAQMALASVLLAALLVPMGLGRAPLGAYGDVIVLIYVIVITAVAVVIGAAASESPYASVGMAREIMLLLVADPIVVIALLTGAVQAHSLHLADIAQWQVTHGLTLPMFFAAIAVFLYLQVQVGKLPFDIAEAEQEIMGGPFVEMSGPKFALMKWMFWTKQVVFASLLTTVFIPWPYLPLTLFGASGPAMALAGAVAVIVNLIKILVVILLIGLIDAVVPRLRIDQALSYFLGLLFVALVGLALAFVA